MAFQPTLVLKKPAKPKTLTAAAWRGEPLPAATWPSNQLSYKKKCETPKTLTAVTRPANRSLLRHGLPTNFRIKKPAKPKTCDTKNLRHGPLTAAACSLGWRARAHLAPS